MSLQVLTYSVTTIGLCERSARQVIMLLNLKLKLKLRTCHSLPFRLLSDLQSSTTQQRYKAIILITLTRTQPYCLLLVVFQVHLPALRLGHHVIQETFHLAGLGIQTHETSNGDPQRSGDSSIPITLRSTENLHSVPTTIVNTDLFLYSKA